MRSFSAITTARPRRALSLGALALASALMLSGCAPVAPTFTQAQLTKVVRAADAPGGYAVSGQSSAAGASDKYQQYTNLSKAGNISPARCADLSALEGVASAADLKGGVNDKVVDMARYTLDSATNPYEFLAVQGRIFSKPDGAANFLDEVGKVAGNCTGGYTTQAVTQSTVSAPALNVETVVTSAVDALPKNVAGISVIELSGDTTNDPSYRVAFIQRGNAVLAISAGIKPTASINYTPADELVAALAKQLAAAK